MRRVLCAGLLASASALLGLGAAQAATMDLGYNLSVTGTGVSGTIDLDLSGSGPTYTVIGGIGSLTVDGSTLDVTGMTTYAGDDQRFSPTLAALVDFPGVSFSLSGGGAINIFAFGPGNYGLLLFSQNSSGDPYGGKYYSVALADPGPVPELSTWAMMGLGFAGLAFVATGRRKTPIAALG
jgi:hypothetical protein